MRPLKHFLPKSLYGRALMIIILPVVIMQVLVTYMFFNAHWAAVTANMTNSVAADIGLAVELYEQAPDAQQAERLNELMRPGLQLSVALDVGQTLPEAPRNSFFSALDKTLRGALDQNIDRPFWFDTTRYPNYIDIRVQVDEGVLRFITVRERVFAPSGFMFIFWLVMASAFLTFVSVVFIRNQARPITKLADAADAFGKGRDISSFRPSGAKEVRLAGQSFLKMRRRLARHIDQRASFLAGVSHDLRTPLTRLKLHMAMEPPSEETTAARQDIKDMENMLEAYLDFAKGLPGEASEPVLLSEFAKEVIDRQGGEGRRPELKILSDGEVTLKRRAMGRVLQNLIGNALRYGQSCRITIGTRSGGGASNGSGAEILVEDDGPGIAKADREMALQPFQRLDEARNQNVEGIGLGLAIARDIVQAHGGDLTLSASEDMGGLKVEIYLPL